jgi:putative transposase
MPRPARLLLSQSYYHIMTRGNNRNVVFKSKSDYCYYLKPLKKYKLELPFDLYHYCLMPNHVHMLIQTKKASDFSLFMKKINLAYFHHYRQAYDWVGHFWQDRFKSQPVGKDEYFIQCGKYIELNPVRKNLVKRPQDYFFSSYKHYANGSKNLLVTEDFFYEKLGTNNQIRQEKYCEMVISDIVNESYQKSVWGDRRQRYREKDKASKYFSYHKKEVKEKFETS